MTSRITIGEDSLSNSNIKELSPVFVILIFIKELVSAVGVIIHEFSHYIMCKLLSVEIYTWSLFTVPDNKGDEFIFGYFEYETPSNYRQTLLINTAPLYVNTSIGLLLFYTIDIFSYSTGVSYIILFIIISIFAKALPSIGDVENINKYNSKPIGIHYSIINKPLNVLAELQLYFIDYVLAILFVLFLL